MKIDRYFAVPIVAIIVLSLSGAAIAQRPHTLTGDIRVHKSFHSKILNNDREVLVCLPAGYENNQNTGQSEMLRTPASQVRHLADWFLSICR